MCAYAATSGLSQEEKEEWQRIIGELPLGFEIHFSAYSHGEFLEPYYSGPGVEQIIGGIIGREGAKPKAYLGSRNISDSFTRTQEQKAQIAEWVKKVVNCTLEELQKRKSFLSKY